MRAIGFVFLGTGTGERVAHDMVADGPFGRVAQQLAATGFAILWGELTQRGDGARQSCKRWG